MLSLGVVFFLKFLGLLCFLSNVFPHFCAVFLVFCHGSIHLLPDAFGFWLEVEKPNSLWLWGGHDDFKAELQTRLWWISLVTPP